MNLYVLLKVNKSIISVYYTDITNVIRVATFYDVQKNPVTFCVGRSTGIVS